MGVPGAEKKVEPDETDIVIVFRVIFSMQKLLQNIWNMFLEKVMPAPKKFPTRPEIFPTRPEIFQRRPLAGTGERSDFSTFREQSNPPDRKAKNEKS